MLCTTSTTASKAINQNQQLTNEHSNQLQRPPLLKQHNHANHAGVHTMSQRHPLRPLLSRSPCLRHKGSDTPIDLPKTLPPMAPPPPPRGHCSFGPQRYRHKGSGTPIGSSQTPPSMTHTRSPIATIAVLGRNASGTKAQARLSAPLRYRHQCSRLRPLTTIATITAVIAMPQAQGQTYRPPIAGTTEVLITTVMVVR